ncbi:MAG: hypothetical protein J1E96_02265 [Ruminococcus sp.]|nr:hypothetical protein [Ruminococcus sp.]
MVWLIVGAVTLFVFLWLYSCVIAGARADRELRRLSAQRFNLKIQE